ncbi:uncharacterized protein LOC101205174 [Cucumis sativus]|uniref:Methyltransferase type 11 domain-containing protein n=1 Tax=Cucumis sativus TaxID=3659 RepID=A0A0A0LA40_CUCSA|nr:uncharacterized protein LOC101205174 [Cucumis sativus]KGN58713.1 hypothetical protein Csa_000842 [Cucumis sativus]
MRTFLSLRNFFRALLIPVFLLVAHFSYVVITTGQSCITGNFCFSPKISNYRASGLHPRASAIIDGAAPTAEELLRRDLYTTKDWIKAVHFYSSIFQDLLSVGFLSHKSKSLCVETPNGQDVFSLKQIGVSDSIGIFKKASKPLVIKGQGHEIPFDDDTFDFIFLGVGRLDQSSRPGDFAREIARTLKPEGFAVVQIRAKDTYSFHSFIALFNCCKIVTSQDINGPDSSMPFLRQIVLTKGSDDIFGHDDVLTHQPKSDGKCSIPGFKEELIRKAEPLILEEPLKPWITLKRNIQKIRYLPSMADVSFKQRYVYVDVGARSYGSSIGSWFKKQYPKQNKTFDVYAIEADKIFHEQYSSKKGVELLPYAAWVRNETLTFEINRDPGQKVQDKGRGMGRIRPVVSSTRAFDGEVDEIQGFDFADWLKNTVTEKDFVVMKMDVEGTEFDLIPRLFKTGAICLIDELFLECHYNRWQRCCPGERSAKYDKTYGQCLDLFASLRRSGVLVHQWW